MPFEPATSFVPSAPTVFASTVAPVVAAEGASDVVVEGAVDAAVEGGAACEAAWVAGALVAAPLHAARTRISGSKPAATAMRCRPMGVPPEGLFVLFFTGSSTSGTGPAVSDAASSNVQIVSRRSTIPVAMAPGHDGDMDTLLTVAGLSVAI